jgi:hypothetical protein
MKTTSKEMAKVESVGDAMVEAGLETRQEAEESNEFERRVMGYEAHTCSNCGEEVGRNQRRCGLCGCRL